MAALAEDIAGTRPAEATEGGQPPLDLDSGGEEVGTEEAVGAAAAGRTPDPRADRMTRGGGTPGGSAMLECRGGRSVSPLN